MTVTQAATPADVFPAKEPVFARHATRRSVVHSTKGIVSCTQPLAARAGIKVLEAGGNAADAAVATAAALNVCEPMATGIGGDLFCLFYDASTKRIRALNGTGRSPAALSLAEVREKLGAPADMPEFGPLSVTVPGSPAGWIDCVELFGSRKLDLHAILAPAIELAETGYGVGQITAQLWGNLETALKGASPNFAEMLKADSSAPDGCRAPRPGELFRNKNLARVFRDLAEGGKKAFYGGETGKAIVEVLQQLGGAITLEDLMHHAELPPDETEVISLKVDGLGIKDPVELWQHGPNSQGIVALLTLGMLQELEKEGKIPTFKPEDHNSTEYLHALIECLRSGFADGSKYITDHHHLDAKPADLLHPSYLSHRAAAFDASQRNKDLLHGVPADVVGGGNTVYFSVTDAQGNACSFVNSNYEEFGSRIVPRNCGFVLQNRGAGFHLDPPDHPNIYAARKRPFHTLTCPMLTFARRDDAPAQDGKGGVPAGDLYSCFGCMGKFMQPQGHVQLLLNQLVFGMNPQEALDAPRVCVEVLSASKGGTRTDRVFVEEGVPESTIAGLRARGHECVVLSGFRRKQFGRGQIIRRVVDDGQLVWSAGGEMRGDGYPMPL